MLSRMVCMNCWEARKYWDVGRTRQDIEDQWDQCHYAPCYFANTNPDRADEEKCEGTIMGEPPEYCLYRLEHIIAHEGDKSCG